MAIGKTYERIASQTVSSSSVTFNNIPQNYTDLVLIIVSKQAGATGSIRYDLRFNGDSGSNYSTARLWGNGTGPSADRFTSQNAIDVAFLGGTDGDFGTSTVNIMNYSSSFMNKTVIYQWGSAGSSSASRYILSGAGLWRSTAPITTLSVTVAANTMASGSTFTLYGIERSKTPKAEGGDVVVSDGIYWYHAFRSSGAFIPKESLTADSLVLGGGGGGGTTNSSYFACGGGGAGGYVYTTGSSLTSNTKYTITIGAGGVGNTTSSPEFGTKSTFNSINAYGGGRGYPGQNSVPNDSLMGSGGGGAAGQTASTTYLAAGQGNKGGDTTSYGGAGGGGAGSAAANITSGFQGGDGGNGLNTLSSWAYATGTGVNGYYAAGGGGGNSPYYGTPTKNPTTGGLGGGGNGAQSGIVLGSAQHGVPGTGSGGGGGSATNNLTYYSYGGNGGSGLVIVRYPV